MINLQHIFHIRHECGICLRRNDKLLVQVRPEKVFFSVRPLGRRLGRRGLETSHPYGSAFTAFRYITT